MHIPGFAVGGDFLDAALEPERAAELFDLGYELGADLGVVDDALLGDVEGGEAADMGLDLEHGRAVEEADAGEAVGGGAGGELVEALFLLGGGGHDELAADLVGDAVLAAEVDHLADAGDGEAGLEGAGLVVEAGMEDAAVVGALVAAGAGFLFEEGDLGGGVGLEEAVGGGQADDSSADDGDPGGHA